MADTKLCAGCQRDDEDITDVSWCSDCSELVCKACSRVHKRMSPSHKVVPMKEMSQLSSSLLILSKNCENHPDQAISLYCCQHDKVICDSCGLVSHQNCKTVMPIEKAARGVKDGTALSDLERRISNLCQVTENRWSQSETTLVDLEKSRTNIKKRVSEIKQKVIAHLDRLEAEIHKDIDSKYKTCTEMVYRNRNSIQSSSDSLSIWRSDLKSLKQHTSEIHLFQVVKYLDAKTYRKEWEIREIQTTDPILKYHPSQSESNIYDDRLLLSHHMKKQLFVCTLDGSNSKVVDLDYVPLSITLFDQTHAVVSVGDAGIQIIDLTSLKPGRRIKAEGICRGITSGKGKIWVANKSNILTILNINGKVLNTIQTRFDTKEICANRDGSVYCTDFVSDTVYEVTSDGKQREIYNSPYLKLPTGIAVDDRGDVYVSGGVSNNIHRISNAGQKHDIVLTADDGIFRPTALSYNNETKELFVLHDYGRSIKIYKT